MKIHEVVNETTTAGGIATVVNPKGKIKRGKYGAPEADQPKNPDGTAKNALDIDTNVLGSKAIKR